VPTTRVPYCIIIRVRMCVRFFVPFGVRGSLSVGVCSVDDIWNESRTNVTSRTIVRILFCPTPLPLSRRERRSSTRLPLERAHVAVILILLSREVRTLRAVHRTRVSELSFSCVLCVQYARRPCPEIRPTTPPPPPLPPSPTYGRVPFLISHRAVV